MGDDHHRAAFGTQRVQRGKQPLFFARGQYRRGFVENEHLGIAVQQLEDLHPLLNANRQMLDLGPRVNRQPVFVRNLLQTSGGGV